MEELNQVVLCGIVDDEPEYSHQYGTNFYYKFNLRVQRLSQAEDVLPVVFNKRFVACEIKKGMRITVAGWINSMPKTFYSELTQRNVVKRIINVTAVQIYESENADNINEVRLSGVLTSKNETRRAKNGRTVIDFVIEIEKSNGKKQRIPCCGWGALSILVENAQEGDGIELTGRLQSYNSTVLITEKEVVHLNTCEVSAKTINRVPRDNNNAPELEAADDGQDNPDVRNADPVKETQPEV